MPGHSRKEMFRIIPAVLALLAFIFIIYGGTLNNEFVNFDDYQYIVENTRIQEGLSWQTIRWAFTTCHMSNWHPLTWLSHAVDCSLFGPDPGYHHLSGVIFHALNSVLLFMLMRRMTGAFWPSLIVSFLFAVHPLRVESVAWASERKDLLSGTFWMLTIMAYSWYAKRPGVSRYATVLVLYSLGLMAKPMLVTLPFVLLLLDIWPLGRLTTPMLRGTRFDGKKKRTREGFPRSRPIVNLIAEKLPLLALALASGTITIIAQNRGGAVAALQGIPVSARIANTCVAYVSYIWKTIWPDRLSFFYPHPSLVSDDLVNDLVLPALGSVVVLVLLSILVLRNVRTRPYLFVGWCWYLGTLVPVIGLFQVGNQAMADRYAYIPLVGIYIMAAWTLRECAARWAEVKPALSITIPVLILTWSAITWNQVRVWRNSETLFTHAVGVSDDNYVAHNNLGNVYARRGDSGRAIYHYERALEILPTLEEAHNNLGLVLAGNGNHEGALAHFDSALSLRPDYIEALVNRGVSLEAMNHTEAAEASYRRAIGLRPDSGAAHLRLAGLLAGQGRHTEAASHYRQAIDHDPTLRDEISDSFDGPANR